MTGGEVSEVNQQSLVSTPHHVSSSELGGGSSVFNPGTTPGVGHGTTPPIPSYPRTADLQGKPVKIKDSATATTQTESYFIGSFSSKACLELLPLLTEDQLKHELIYRQSLGYMTDIRHTRQTDKSVLFKHLNDILLTAIPTEYDNILKNFETLTSNFSYLTDQAQEEVDKLKIVNSSPAKEPPVTPPTPESGMEVKLTESVCCLNHDSIDFAEFTVDDILSQITIDKSGSHGKCTAYFGSRPYSYGHNIHHRPCDYPKAKIFDTILDKMKIVDENFNFEEYTCLITHYPDGKSFIPRHSDNERTIVQDSTIYTISVGATRTLRLTNIKGHLQEHDINIGHGTVYSMSRDSQDIWSHEILPDNNITEPRISFTFRKLTDPPPKDKVPPVKRPGHVKPTIAMGSHHRILFLTDSILESTPEHIFRRVDNHKCIRKTNYRLTDIFNFDPEFAYSDFVIIACGVNDLARHGLSAHTLADLVTRRLSECCDKNPDTTFIYSSILHTKQDWLNCEIDEFNRIMFELSVTVPNMRFFDSHQALVNDRLSNKIDNVIMPADKHGQHLTFAAKKLFSDQLVMAIKMVVGRRQGHINRSMIRGWSWPLREKFVRIFRQIAANFTVNVVR